MTALFCQPHPVLNYRTDVYIGNKNVCIPPGETRTITIEGALEPVHGLSLLETGWRVACWNAEDVTVAPATSVLLSFGRQDGTTFGFSRELGHDGVRSAGDGGHLDAAEIPHFVSAKSPLHITFDLTPEQVGASVLRLHTADRSQQTTAVVEVTLNDRPYELTLPTGIGRHDTEPGRPGLPATTTLALPADGVRPGMNVLALTISNDGWFTWDALDLALRS
jgi:hypothetical protein